MASPSAMHEVRARLVKIVGEAGVEDHGPAAPGATGQPWLTVRPADSDQVQAIVRLANETLTPLVPVSSAAPHQRGTVAPGVANAVVVDLSGMRRIPRIDRRTRIALIEPGVTFEQLVPALAAEGLRIAMPLVPRPGKSVLASLLEREPLVAPRFAWNALEPLRTLEVIWGNGERLYTGNGHLRGEDDAAWGDGQVPLVAGGPAQLDFYRLIVGAQGSMGIATWASVKCEPVSADSTLLFLVADRLEDLVPCAYELVKIRFGDETFIMDAAGMGHLLGADPDALPRWMLVVGIGGGSIAAAQKLAGREADVREIAARHGLEILEAIPGATGAELLARLQAPSSQPCWREQPSGRIAGVSFLATLDRAVEFIETAGAALGGPVAAADMGVYLQPIHQGAGLHIELLLPGALATQEHAVARAVFERGAYFSRPYGEQAAWVFDADPATAELTRTVKGVFDPRNIMNPGRLCFPATVG